MKKFVFLIGMLLFSLIGKAADHYIPIGQSSVDILDASISDYDNIIFQETGDKTLYLGPDDGDYYLWNIGDETWSITVNSDCYRSGSKDIGASTFGKRVYVLFQIPVTYDLSASASPSAGGSVSPTSQTYDEDDVATVTASANTGWEFDSWSGDLSGSTNPGSVTMNSDKNITANFSQIDYSVTVNSGTADEANYNYGDLVTITANSAPTGQVFDKWVVNSGGASLSNANNSSTTFSMPASDVEVTATYKDIDYSVTVNSGSGDGTYDYGDNVNITANSPATGKEFDTWVVNSGGASLANAGNSSTSFSMPANAVEVTATYKDIDYSVTVNGGTGGGTYNSGDNVNITAGTAPTGQQFKRWVVNSGAASLANANNATTSFTMPANAVEVTAEYELIDYTVTVNSGTGGGTYNYGNTVNISANSAPTGQQFKRWVVNSGGASLANANNASTSFTMPAGNVEVTAEYEDITYSVTVNDGSGDGSYTAGQTVNISANSAPTGQQFKRWVVNSGGASLANANNASTSFTMPANAVEVTAEYENIDYTATVNNGTGGGTYNYGSTVNISADPAPAGQEFAGWVVNSGGVSLANANAENTSFTMPAGNVEVEATYSVIGYTISITAENGSVSKSPNKSTYLYGDAVGLTATPITDYEFDSWTGVDSENGNTASVIVQSNRNITATFVKVYFDVTVTNGSGSGHIKSGTSVQVVANDPPANQMFDHWEVNGATLANVHASSTSFTMPSNDVTLSPVYVDIPCTQPAAPVLEAQGEVDLCAGETVVVNIVSHEVQNFLWSDGVETTSLSREFSAAGSYQVRSVRPDHEVCKSEWSNVIDVTVLEKPGDAGPIDGDVTEVCAGEHQLDFTLADVARATHYDWKYSGTGDLVSAENIRLVLDMNSTSGVLTVTPSNRCGIGAPSEQQITIHPNPVVTLTAQDDETLVCQDADPVELVYSHEFTAVSGPGIDENNNFDPEGLEGVQTLHYLYTDEHGCSDEATLNMEVLVPVHVELGDDIVGCEGETFTLEVPEYTGYTTSWSTDETSNEISVDRSGEVSVTLSNKVCTITDNVTVTLHELPVIVFPSEAWGPYYDDAGVQELPGATTLSCVLSGPGITADQKFDPAQAGGGNHWIKLTAMNLQGCESSDSIQIQVIPTGEVIFESIPDICANAEAIQLPDGLPEGGVHKMNGDVIESFDPAIGVGTYDIWYVYTYLDGVRKDSAKQTITVKPVPVFTMDTYVETCEHSVQIGEVMIGAVFNWLELDNDFRSFVTVTESGTYHVEANLNGCKEVEAIEVKINPVQVSHVFENICVGDTYKVDGFINEVFDEAGVYQRAWRDACDSTHVTITVHGAPEQVDLLGDDIRICEQIVTLRAPEGYASYTWQDGSTGLQHVVTGPGVFDVSLEVTDEYGCGSISDNVRVDIPPLLPYYELPQNNQITITEPSVTIDLNTYLAPYGVILDELDVEWSGGEVTPVVTLNPGTHTVTVSTECESREHTFVIVQEEEPNGIEELSAQVLLYPNPVVSTLYVRSNEVLDEVKIYSPLGKLIVTHTMVKDLEISMDTYAPGMYLVQLCYGNTIHYEKIIKNKE